MKKAGIWVDSNTFMPLSGGNSALSAEVATRERYGLQTFSYGLPNPDPVLKKMGKDISAYRDVMGMAHVRGCIRNRKAGAMCLQWGIDRGRAKGRQVRLIADLFSSWDMSELFGQILDACQFGYQPVEVIWQKAGEYILPQRLSAKPQEWFVFGRQNDLRLRSSLDVAGVPVDPRKFLLPRQEPTYLNPYGFADLSSCFWPAMISRNGLGWWSTFAEKFGIPYILGKTPRGTDPKENEKLLALLDAMVQDAVAVIPADSSVEVKEPDGKSASVEVFNSLLRFCREEISIVQLGHPGASQSTPGQLGGQDAAISVRADIVESDRRIIEGAMNMLVCWIWEINFQSTDVPLFSMWREQDVDKSRAERDVLLYNTGLRFKPKYYIKEFGYEEGDIEVAATSPQPIPAAGSQDPATAQFATQAATSMSAFPDQSALDTAAADIPDAELQNQAQGLLRPIVKLINEGKSFEEINTALASQYPDMNPDQLVEMLARARFVAEVWGRLNA